jgi:hypothetical protein
VAGSLNIDWVPEANGLGTQNRVALIEAGTVTDAPSPSGSTAGTGRQQAGTVQNYVAVIEGGNTSA